MGGEPILRTRLECEGMVGRPYRFRYGLNTLPQGQPSLGGSRRVNGREADRWEAGSRGADR